uniref:helix-hairpin-helix domain-containing protein n=1 Tax=Ligilactobacillus sp. TaxID=2767921 RepID=UPI002FDFA86B
DYIYVDIKGAIKHPGVYKVPNGKRVGDVLSLAGGPLEGADTTQINFAHKLEDQMVIYIPKAGESSPIENTVGISGYDSQTNQNSENSMAETTFSAQSQIDSTGQGENDGKINLNTASKEQLMQLTGIGDKKADDIIEYRQQNGNFKTIDELKNVSGIGDKTFEKISSQITV